MKRGKLFSKFLFWFLLISLIPLVGMGYHLVTLTQDSLREESLRVQEAATRRISETVVHYVKTFRNVLAVTARIESFTSMDPDVQRRILERIMEAHPVFLRLSVLNLNGVETVHLERFSGSPVPSSPDHATSLAYLTAIREGEYIGSLEHIENYPIVTIALVVEDPSRRKAVGTLQGKINLIGLSYMLQQVPASEAGAAFVAGPQGFLIAHSDPQKVLAPKETLSPTISEAIQTSQEDSGGREMQLESGEKILGSFTHIKELGWVAFLQQPLEEALGTARTMRKQILTALWIVILATFLLSFMVANHITQPIRALQAASAQIAAGNFDLPEMADTGDEIGELGQAFQKMGSIIQQKTQQLLGAKEELEKLNRSLENRVDARTRELHAAQNELIHKERLAAIGQMASVVGHEIRNPLAVINNSIYFIKAKMSANGKDLDPKLLKHIQIIESEIQQANSIINEILTFARTRELKPERHNFHHFLEELLTSYPFPDAVELRKQIPPGEIWVIMDADEIRQALRNILGNSIQAMTEGGKIFVSLKPHPPKSIQLEISDTGPGIPAEILDKVFTPFFTTKPSGTGLGLAVVRKVMDRHHGTVEVRSVPGQGTSFTLHLPLPAAAAPSPGAAQKKDHA
ncbi:MAG: HAMP domain-containing protein [Elusimicrobia bacterium]|nr:HAMP domain-containing protein [Elusimicrobiota bacterium]